jgi:membrane protease YdiL (CAAX protease family)
LAAFFLLAFALGWAALAPLAAESHGLVAFDVPPLLLLPLVGWGPGLAAAVVALASGRGRDFGARLTQRRFGFGWWAAALLGPGVLFGLASAIHVILGGSPPRAPGLDLFLPIGIGLTFVLGLLTDWEEVGWRGFALPRLLERHEPLEASLLVGLLTTAWHLPYFFWVGGPLGDTPFPAFAVLTLSGSVVLTWLTRGAGGSALPAVLWQAATTTWQALVVFGPGETRPFELSAGLCALAAGLLVVTGRLRPADGQP